MLLSHMTLICFPGLKKCEKFVTINYHHNFATVCTKWPPFFILKGLLLLHLHPAIYPRGPARRGEVWAWRRGPPFVMQGEYKSLTSQHSRVAALFTRGLTRNDKGLGERGRGMRGVGGGERCVCRLRCCKISCHGPWSGTPQQRPGGGKHHQVAEGVKWRIWKRKERHHIS